MQQRRAAEQKARPQQPVRPVAGLARPKARHLAIALSFVLLVVAPVAVSGWYLYARAADQFASFVGFSVRSESGPTGSELLGGLGSLIGATSSSGSDTDILYKFIQSRDLVERVNKRMDLRAIWSKPEGDPVFSFRGNDSLESLLAEWERKVRVYYDNGMIDLRVLSFDPTDSRQIAQAILDEGTLLINQLNDVAREDSLRYARTELDDALARLKQARQAVSEFRNRHQLVDPSADVQGQVGVVTSLNQQLAEELVSLGMLQANAQANDPRIEQTQLRINVIRDQIDAERRKFGSDSESGEVLSDIVGQYESLSIDRQFAEQTYTAALAAYDTARAEANRQSRYLAAYVKPTLAQEAEYPERAKLLLILGGFLMLLWVIGVLIYYSLRDRR
ncbi:MAG: sugar transporter [Paracoccus sp.]|nr:sugar transporter [Paracoccus sp. (in: a-proteobacteria)]